VTTADAPRGDDEEAQGAGLLALGASGLAVGALSGLVGSAFHVALDAADKLRLAVLAWSRGDPRLGWIAPVLFAAVAAFVARWLVRRFAPETAGSGVQHVEAVVNGDAEGMRAIVLPIKFVGGVLALGAGLALGREGPTVQMSATIGHLWSRWVRLRPEDSRALLVAGAGAGLAAAFNAPLAGALFVFEELLRRFELRAAVATLAACSAGLVTMRMLTGDRLIFSVPQFAMEIFPGYLLFLALGAIMGALGVLYIRLVVAGLDVAKRLRRVSPEVKAGAVGAIIGAFSWIGPFPVGGGELQVQWMLDGGHSLALIATLFCVRLVLGPLSYAPGLPGGLFAPMLVVGGAAGLAVGMSTEILAPVMNVPMPAFVAAGMCAFFVAVVRAPLTGIALIIEMTGATSVFVPLLTVCTTALVVPALFGARPIYDTLRDRAARR